MNMHNKREYFVNFKKPSGEILWDTITTYNDIRFEDALWNLEAHHEDVCGYHIEIISVTKL